MVENNGTDIAYILIMRFILLISLTFSSLYSYSSSLHCAGSLSLVSYEIEKLWQIEQTENIKRFMRETGYQDVPYKLVSKESFKLRTADNISPEIIDALFKDENTIRWPQHPMKLLSHKGSTSDIKVVPFYSAEADGVMSGQLSSSRSVFFSHNNYAYSIKIPSNYFGYSKNDLRKSVDISMLRSDTIRKIDEQIGKDSSLILLLDVLSVAYKSPIDYSKDEELRNYNPDGNGFVVRDMSVLQDGMITIPGFAMNKYLSNYANKFQKSKYEVTKELAAIYGKSIIDMYIRYGLVMAFPHDQNYLIRFDRDGQLLSQIVWRDLSDTVPNIELQEKIGLSKFAKETSKKNYENTKEFKFHSANGYFIGQRAKYISKVSLVYEIEQYMKKYVNSIFELGLRDSEMDDFDISSYLSSSEGVNRIAEYHARMRE